MKNVILVDPNPLTVHTYDWLREQYPEAEVTANFEQVLAYAKLGELSKLCIFFGGFNIDGCSAVEEINKVSSKVKYLIWGGGWEKEDKDMLPGEFDPIKVGWPKMEIMMKDFFNQ